MFAAITINASKFYAMAKATTLCLSVMKTSLLYLTELPVQGAEMPPNTIFKKKYPALVLFVMNMDYKDYLSNYLPFGVPIGQCRSHLVFQRQQLTGDCCQK